MGIQVCGCQSNENFYRNHDVHVSGKLKNGNDTTSCESSFYGVGKNPWKYSLMIALGLRSEIMSLIALSLNWRSFTQFEIEAIKQNRLNKTCMGRFSVAWGRMPTWMEHSCHNKNFVKVSISPTCYRKAPNLTLIDPWYTHEIEGRMERFSMVGWVFTHLDDMLASQYQSIDWTLHASCQRSICWGNLLAPAWIRNSSGQVK